MVSAAVFAAVFAAFLFGVKNTQTANSAEELRIAKESIERAVMTCYAIEGSYPDTYDYLVKNYGVRVDTDKYFVDYKIFASNIMPDVTVIEKK